MRNYIYLLFFLPSIVLAQATEFGSFKVMNNEVVFQKVFVNDSATIDKIAGYLKTIAGEISSVEIVNGAVQAELSEFKIDFKKFGFQQTTVPSLVQTGRYGAKITVDGKPGKYRVTLKNITVKGDAGYKKITAPDSFTNYAGLNSGTMLNKDWCKPNSLGLIEKALADLFTLPEKDNADW